MSTNPLSILTFWNRFSLRHARREWMQSLLLLLILGLGVGTFLSIRMANRAAVEGFQLFTESLSGGSDWIVEAPADGIPVDRLPEIRAALDPLPAQLFPVVERTLSPLPGDGSSAAPMEAPVRLLGLDLVQIRSVATSSGEGGMEDFWSIIDDPRHLLVSQAVADRWNTAEGAETTRVMDGQTRDRKSVV